MKGTISRYAQWVVLLAGLLDIHTACAASKPKPGAEFQDCPGCPVMVVIPAGRFQMGSPEDEPERSGDEGPQHTVAIGYTFAAGKYEVTFDEWDACVADGGCPKAADYGMGRGKQPVVDVNWDDAIGYTEWLSHKTGQRYRLLTEAEWEYAARAGTSTRYHTGNYIGEGMANCGECGSQWDNRKTAPAGSFPPNAFGLHDMLGNVWEWVEDSYHESYKGAPTDGSAWNGETARILRGGSWYAKPQNVRSAKRMRSSRNFRDADDGFRVAKTLN